jgi:hypothetical protein
VPYYFVCPQCNENNYGMRAAPTASANGTSYAYNFYQDLKCSRCGASGLYWVLTDRAAQALAKGPPAIPRNRIAVGAWPSDIGWFDPDGRAEIQKEVVSLMRNVATLTSSFNQGERQKALLPQRVDVAEGLCEGMSLHWIRRVLLGGKESFTVDKRKRGVDRSDAVRLAKLKRQLTVGANVQVTDVQSAWNDRHLTGLGFTKLGGDQWSIPANLQTLWDQTQAKGIYAKHWADLSAAYDRQLNVGDRRSARPFSNIVCVSSMRRREQPLGDFVANMCRDTAFGPGTAVLLSIGLRVGVGESGGAISGHAIAAYCRSDNEQFLFDPNIGVWVCTTRDRLRQAIELLVGTGWTTRLQWRLEGTYGYSLFQARATEANVAPRERPLLMTPSPQTTAIENRGLMPSVLPPVRVPSSSPTQPRPSPSASPSPSPAPVSTTPTPSTTRPVTTPSTPSVSPSGAGGGRFRPQGPAQAPSGVGGAGSLKARLQAAMNDPSKHRDKRAGVGTADGLGYCQLPQELCKEIIAAKVAVGNAGLKGESPMGDWIMKGTLQQVINMLR